MSIVSHIRRKRNTLCHLTVVSLLLAVLFKLCPLFHILGGRETHCAISHCVSLLLAGLFKLCPLFHISGGRETHCAISQCVSLLLAGLFELCPLFHISGGRETHCEMAQCVSLLLAGLFKLSPLSYLGLMMQRCCLSKLVLHHFSYNCGRGYDLRTAIGL